MRAKGCLLHSITSLQGQWELISTDWVLALGEKTTAVMHGLFFQVSFCMLADVIGDVSSCAKCTWLTTSVKHSEWTTHSLHCFVVGWSWPKQINNQVLCFCRGCSLSFELKLVKNIHQVYHLFVVIFWVFGYVDHRSFICSFFSLSWLTWTADVCLCPLNITTTA